MRTLIAAITIFTLIGLTNPLNAQRTERFRGERNISERREAFMQQRNSETRLTDDQKEKFRALRIETEKKLKPFQDQLSELMAKHQTLVTADKPDMKAIETSLSQISKTRLEMAKIRAARHQEVRAQLTEEQRLMFDKRRGMLEHRKGFRPPVR